MFSQSEGDQGLTTLPVEHIVRIPIRRIPLVVDIKEPLTPELTLEDFMRLYGKEPDQDRFRVLSIELITSPDDQQPMLVSECGKYDRFLRRENENVYFRVVDSQ